MKKLLFIIVAALMTSFATAQVKDRFELKSIPVYDMDGNVYIVVKSYDHVPTRQDSLDFEAYRKVEVRRMLEGVQKANKPKPYKPRKKSDKTN